MNLSIAAVQAFWQELEKIAVEAGKEIWHQHSGALGGFHSGRTYAEGSTQQVLPKFRPRAEIDAMRAAEAAKRQAAEAARPVRSATSKAVLSRAGGPAAGTVARAVKTPASIVGRGASAFASRVLGRL